MAGTVMVFGLGAVGEIALQILARCDGIDKLWPPAETRSWVSSK